MLREAKLEEAGRVHEIIAREIAAYDATLPRPSGFSAHGEGAIEASIRGGDIIWIDDDDPRRVAWAHPNDPRRPTSIFLMHAWAPSEKHVEHLEEVCDVIIRKGWGDVEIKFPRANTPITNLVDEKFLREDQKDGQLTGKTTAAEAKDRVQETKVDTTTSPPNACNTTIKSKEK